MHRRIIKDTFGVMPKVFRNTELAYNDDLAKWADNKGYSGILAEGWDAAKLNYCLKIIDYQMILLFVFQIMDGLNGH